uniref:Uncharacterized protein n=1 Tax=Oryzias sinensis TaxID=183150 RepID=A0A8C7Z4X9_9TELE
MGMFLLYLYLSSRKSANDSSQLKVNKITCIINVSEARSSCPPGVDEYVHIPVSDSPLTVFQQICKELSHHATFCTVPWFVQNEDILDTISSISLLN